MITIKFEYERTTSGAVRFQEVLENELDAPKIGQFYVKKPTLGELGWKEGDTITVTIDKG